jgi:hypothetical protein
MESSAKRQIARALTFPTPARSATTCLLRHAWLLQRLSCRPRCLGAAMREGCHGMASATGCLFCRHDMRRAVRLPWALRGEQLVQSGAR